MRVHTSSNTVDCCNLLRVIVVGFGFALSSTDVMALAMLVWNGIAVLRQMVAAVSRAVVVTFHLCKHLWNAIFICR